ncbi:MAG: M20/M25/M40 family metallo-hydrolase, partial [Paracoccus sp. (in: a-proteobacteria)]|nr:M20/M25/M40 family metallo-hydrolase [Paracoccus sp. (in: a-proteobacteria)]
MDPLELPFDEADMLARLRPWIECESPTFDADAVARMMALAAKDCAALGASVDHIEAQGGFGPSIRVRFPHPGHDKVPGILVSGHMDTVHPIGTITKNPWRTEDGKAWGPGIQDMKGGNFAMIEAAAMLHRKGIETPLPVTFLFTPDEEVGTPATRDLIEAEAKRNACVLLPEPALADGGAVTGRYAIARFNLETRGVPAHAGWALQDGRSAIAEMARRVLEIEAMTTPDCTFSVGVIHAGQWVNCVASSCHAEVLSMAKADDDLARGVAMIEAMQETRNGVEFIVTRGVTRPVWKPAQEGTMALYELARDISARLGFDLTHDSSGGGSDGNFTG